MDDRIHDDVDGKDMMKVFKVVTRRLIDLHGMHGLYLYRLFLK
jgi:hypothetical protein